MIKAIAFDYGGVIEITDGDLFQNIANFLQISKEDWQKMYFSLNHLNNTGKKTTQEVLALVAKEFNASEDQISHLHNMTEEHKKTKRINLELIEIIKDLKDKNYKIGLLSNNSVKLRQKLIDKNIIDSFDEVIISAEVGYQKPQPEIFEILFSKLGVNNDEIIFVDDTPQSLLNSNDIGYIPLLYVNNKKLKEDLLKML